MKNIFLVVVSLFIISIVHSQDIGNYTAMILSLNGEGVLSRNSSEQKLDLPQRYKSGDVLSITSGRAIIMLFSGEEITVSAQSKYTIPRDESPELSSLHAMVNDSDYDQSILSQSGVAYRIRGDNKVFPLKSMLLNKENAVLRISYETIHGLSLNLKIYDQQTQKIIYEKDAINDSTVSLHDVPFLEGKSYYWVISNAPHGKPEMGTIVIPKKEELDKLILTDVSDTHFESINVISTYTKNNCYFEAYSLIENAVNKYPDYQIYKVLLNNILCE